jgi:hypothetical protein
MDSLKLACYALPFYALQAGDPINSLLAVLGVGAPGLAACGRLLPPWTLLVVRL